MAYYHGKILIYDLIGEEFSLFHHIPGDGVHLSAVFQRYVYGHILITHMEAAVGAAEFAVEHSGEDMFTGMALHVIESSFPVDPEMAFRTFRDLVLCIDHVNELTVFFDHLYNVIGSAVSFFKNDSSGVPGLSSAFRKEYCTVRYDRLMSFKGENFQDHRIGFLKISIFFK